MGARFILSLDCEGKWGVADCLGNRERDWLADRQLREAYGKLLSVLDAYGVPATFAFVGLFGESPDDFRRLLPEVERLSVRAPHFLGPALRDIREGSCEGWHGDWAVEAVASSAQAHEIALHGVTHVPWTSKGQDFFAEELALVPHLSGPLASACTFVFPRNEVAHLPLLASAGMRGFRLARPTRWRARRFLSELNLWARPEEDPPIDPELPVPIPAGVFVNWRRGLRGMIPQTISRLRFQRLMDSAEQEQAVVHLWLHPENIASAPSTLDLLDRMLRIVVERREAGRCAVMTQIEYVQERIGHANLKTA